MVDLPTQEMPAKKMIMKLAQAKRVLAHLEAYERWREKEPSRRGEVYPPGVARTDAELIQLLKDSIAVERLRKRTAK